MTRSDTRTSVVKTFLEELLNTLDLEETRQRLGISLHDTRRIIEYLLGGLPREEERVYIYVDGAARGNPGPAGVGIVIKDGEGRLLKKAKKKIGTATNNVAEYTALVEALRLAHAMGKTSVEVFSDSELLVKQINGEYAVRSPALKPLYAKVMEYIDGFNSFHITHIGRARNTLADSLANEAIDGI